MMWVLSKLSRREESKVVDGCEVMYSHDQDRPLWTTLKLYKEKKMKRQRDKCWVPLIVLWLDETNTKV